MTNLHPLLSYIHHFSLRTPPPDAERSPTYYFPPATQVLKMPVDTTRTIPTRRTQRKMTEEEMKEIEMKRIRGKPVKRLPTER